MTIAKSVCYYYSVWLLVIDICFICGHKIVASSFTIGILYNNRPY